MGAIVRWPRGLSHNMLCYYSICGRRIWLIIGPLAAEVLVRFLSLTLNYVPALCLSIHRARNTSWRGEGLLTRTSLHLHDTVNILFGSAIFRAMSQPNAGEKKTRGKRLGDRILRSLGIEPDRSSPIVSNTTTSASSLRPPAPEAMQSPQQSGNNSPQFRELVPAMTIPESLGGPGVEILVPAPPPVVRNPAPPLPSPVTLAPQAGTMSEKNKVGGLWARALERLCVKDKNTLETNETRSNLDIEELLLAVQAKRDMCLENQWRFEFHGRAVNLR